MHIVVIGGGIAGYTCAKTLASLESRYIDSLKDSTNVLGQEVPAEDVRGAIIKTPMHRILDRSIFHF
jgi:flavin-dependent dehydrogenase